MEQLKRIHAMFYENEKAVRVHLHPYNHPDPVSLGTDDRKDLYRLFQHTEMAVCGELRRGPVVHAACYSHGDRRCCIPLRRA